MSQGALQGVPIELDVQRVVLARQFINKLWNGTRFVLHHCGEEGQGQGQGAPPETCAQLAAHGQLGVPARWALSRLARTVGACDRALRNDDMAARPPQNTFRVSVCAARTLKRQRTS